LANGRGVAQFPEASTLRVGFTTLSRSRKIRYFAISIEVDGPISGMEVHEILRQIYATPKDVVAKFEAIRNEK